jgi:hypothetical protein
MRSVGENAHHGGVGHNLVQNSTIANSLFAFDPDAFLDVLAQQSSSLEQFEYVSGAQQYTTKSATKSWSDFPRLREVRLNEHVRDDRRDHLLTGVTNLHFLYLELSDSKVFGPLISLEDEHDVGYGKVASEEVEKRLADKVSTTFFQGVPTTALASLQEIHITFAQIPLPIEGSRKTWIEMLSKYWQSRGVNVFLYYRYHSSIVPPVLYDETDRALRDVLL